KFTRLFSAKQREEWKSGKRRSLTASQKCTIRPREIDIVNTDYRGVENVTRAIYELNDGKLRIAWGTIYGSQRPTSFDEAHENPEVTLFVLRKAQPLLAQEQVDDPFLIADRGRDLILRSQWDEGLTLLNRADQIVSRGLEIPDFSAT